MGAGRVALVPFGASVSAKLRRKKTADSDEMVSNRRAYVFVTTSSLPKFVVLFCGKCTGVGVKCCSHYFAAEEDRGDQRFSHNSEKEGCQV